MEQEMERPQTLPESIVNKAHWVSATMDHSVAAPRILHMAAQFLKRGHNVDQLSTMDSVYFKEKP
jgi:hypothetical protein